MPPAGQLVWADRRSSRRREAVSRAIARRSIKNSASVFPKRTPKGPRGRSVRVSKKRPLRSFRSRAWTRVLARAMTPQGRSPIEWDEDPGRSGGPRPESDPPGSRRKPRRSPPRIERSRQQCERAAACHFSKLHPLLASFGDSSRSLGRTGQDRSAGGTHAVRSAGRLSVAADDKPSDPAASAGRTLSARRLGFATGDDRSSANGIALNSRALSNKQILITGATSWNRPGGGRETLRPALGANLRHRRSQQDQGRRICVGLASGRRPGGKRRWQHSSPTSRPQGPRQCRLAAECAGPLPARKRNISATIVAERI